MKVTLRRDGGAILTRTGRAYSPAGRGWYVLDPRPHEVGAIFLESELRLKHPMAALRRRIARERKDP